MSPGREGGATILACDALRRRRGKRDLARDIVVQMTHPGFAGYWTPLQPGNPDRVCPKEVARIAPVAENLWAMSDEQISRRLIDLAVIGLFAVRTHQFRRTEISRDLVSMQEMAEDMVARTRSR